MNLEIELRKGIGEIAFHKNMDEIVSIIGSPTEIESIGEDMEMPTTIFHYDNLGFRLFFNNDSLGKLSCIDLYNEESTLFNEKIFNLSPEKIILLMKKNNILSFEEEEEAWQEKRVSFHEYNVDFYFNDEKLSSVIFGE
ncbi:MAG: hypothetical protein LBM25_00160 [Bacteroidales bacterium]|jgi:hypothetical protein|nr:hypothetical protein [Bacteroidales bacterium]